MKSLNGAEISDFIEYLYLNHYYDFRNYSLTSLHRRVIFALEKFRLETLSDLKKLLEKDTNMIFNLVSFLTVGTTEMFRDPDYFEYFRNTIIPSLKTYPHPKVWIAGCSSGEEILSYAITLFEENLLHRVHLYATDINPLILKQATSRIFHLSKIKKYSENYLKSGGLYTLSDYFSTSGNFALFKNELFDRVTVSDHCLATDSSFGEFQMISCRNVLIYFNSYLQKRAINLFSESLSWNGYLAFGKNELHRFDTLGLPFSALDSKGVYQKAEARTYGRSDINGI